MDNLAAKLNAIRMKVCESFLVQFILNSLPAEFGQFQVNYYILKEKWNFQEIKAMLIQEEGRLKKMKDNSIHLMAHDRASTSKSKPSKKGKGKFNLKVKDGGVCKEKKCYFYRESGHFKKDFSKRKKQFEKEGIFYISVNFESNLVEVPGGLILEKLLMCHILCRDSFQSKR